MRFLVFWSFRGGDSTEAVRRQAWKLSGWYGSWCTLREFQSHSSSSSEEEGILVSVVDEDGSEVVASWRWCDVLEHAVKHMGSYGSELEKNSRSCSASSLRVEPSELPQLISLSDRLTRIFKPSWPLGTWTSSFILLSDPSWGFVAHWFPILVLVDVQAEKKNGL